MIKLILAATNKMKIWNKILWRRVGFIQSKNEK